MSLTLLCLRRGKQTAGSFADVDDGRADSGEITLYSPLKVLLFVAMMCVMLVLMYFFYTWLGECVCGALIIFRKTCSGN